MRCLLHEFKPDRQRRSRARFLLAQRDAFIVVADPHARGELGRKADVPGIGKIVGGSGLSRRGPAELFGADAGAKLHDVLEHGDHRASDIRRDHVGDVRARLPREPRRHMW